MRVIAGSARGRKIQSVEGVETRPTLDRVKESVFGILQFEIADEPVLDLFAGSGGLGIEALSRGASFCTFADRRADCANVVRKNLETLGFWDRASVRTCDYLSTLTALENEGAKFKLVFLDPPYGSGLGVMAAKRLVERKMLLSGAIVVVEDDKPTASCPGEFIVYDVRKYGGVHVSFLKADAEGMT